MFAELSLELLGKIVIKSEIHCTQPPLFFSFWSPSLKNYEAVQSYRSVLGTGGKEEQMLVEMPAASFLSSCPFIFRGSIIIWMPVTACLLTTT